jgi:4-hydroxy-3-methylbut-2-enyl diphosphate reductase
VRRVQDPVRPHPDALRAPRPLAILGGMASNTALASGIQQIVRAIDIVELALQVCPYPVYVRKEIVHNRHVVEALRAKGAHFVDELDEVPDGATVIFSAHGISPAVREEAQRRGLYVIDATCPLVTKVHLEAIRYAREGYSIILVGHADHDEVVGTMGEAPDRMFLIAHPEDVDRLDVPDPEKVAYLTQTTLSVDDTRDCIEALRRRFPRIVGPSKDDICYATQNRQAAVKTVAMEVDVLLVIGAANSSNANRLVEVSRGMGTPSYLINDKNDVRAEWIEGARRVGVTAGASTPEFLVSEVVDEVRRARRAEVREVHVVEEDVRFGLPRELEEMAAHAGKTLPPRSGKVASE